MKKIYFLLIVILLSSNIFAQEIIAFNPIIVDEDDTEAYEKNNKEYIVKLAQDAVDEKHISGWILLKKMHGELFPDNDVNYILVSGFESINQLLTRPEWWNKSEEKFGIPIFSISKFSRDDASKSTQKFSTNQNDPTKNMMKKKVEKSEIEQNLCVLLIRMQK